MQDNYIFDIYKNCTNSNQQFLIDKSDTNYASEVLRAINIHTKTRRDIENKTIHINFICSYDKNNVKKIDDDRDLENVKLENTRLDIELVEINKKLKKINNNLQDCTYYIKNSCENDKHDYTDEQITNTKNEILKEADIKKNKMTKEINDINTSKRSMENKIKENNAIIGVKEKMLEQNNNKIILRSLNTDSCSEIVKQIFSMDFFRGTLVGKTIHDLANCNIIDIKITEKDCCSEYYIPVNVNVEDCKDFYNEIKNKYKNVYFEKPAGISEKNFRSFGKRKQRKQRKSKKTQRKQKKSKKSKKTRRIGKSKRVSLKKYKQ